VGESSLHLYHTKDRGPRGFLYSVEREKGEITSKRKKKQRKGVFGGRDVRTESKGRETDKVFLNTFGAEMDKIEAWSLFPNNLSGYQSIIAPFTFHNIFTSVCVTEHGLLFLQIHLSISWNLDVFPDTSQQLPAKYVVLNRGVFLPIHRNISQQRLSHQTWVFFAAHWSVSMRHLWPESRCFSLT